jgi:hypothetical protein
MEPFAKLKDYLMFVLKKSLFKAESIIAKLCI